VKNKPNVTKKNRDKAGTQPVGLTKCVGDKKGTPRASQLLRTWEGGKTATKQEGSFKKGGVRRVRTGDPLVGSIFG